MKRAIVLSVRESKDKNTNENTVWVTLGIMPSKYGEGKIFYPKSSEICVSTVAGELRNPDNYKLYKDLKIGDIVNVVYGFNEFTQKPFVNELLCVCETPYSIDDLIV